MRAWTDAPWRAGQGGGGGRGASQPASTGRCPWEVPQIKYAAAAELEVVERVPKVPSCADDCEFASFRMGSFNVGIDAP